MQPLLYLTTRILLSYLQALLREERIFLQAATSTLATGGGHCWALVYGLMIAVLMQSVRMQGTPDTSALPWWMNFAERLASTTMLLWTLAGTAAAYIRIVQVDEQLQGLPVYGIEDGCPCPTILAILQSKKFRFGVRIVYHLSGVILFLSVVLLALCILPGALATIHAGDLGIIVISTVFATPHLVVAMAVSDRPGSRDSYRDGWLAAASEASILGPQLCLVIAVAGATNHAPGWSSILYLLTAIVLALDCVLTGLFASHHGSERAANPSLLTFVTSSLMDLAAMLLMVLGFPVLRDGLFWTVVVLTILALGALSVRSIREPLVEMMEPIMPFRSSISEYPDNAQAKAAASEASVRDISRVSSQVLALASACLAFGGVVNLHEPAPDAAAYYEPAKWEEVHHDDHYYHHEDSGNKYDYRRQDAQHFDDHDHSEHYDDYPYYPHHDEYHDLDFGWDSPWLMVRWRGEGTEQHDQVELLLQAVAQAIGLHREDLMSEHVLMEHRILLFRSSSPLQKADSLARQTAWQDAVRELGFDGEPEGLDNDEEKRESWRKLKSLIDPSFPAQLDITFCHELHVHHVMTTAEASPESPEREAPIWPVHREEYKQAYRAICERWHQEHGYDDEWDYHYDYNHEHIGHLQEHLHESDDDVQYPSDPSDPSHFAD